MKAWARALALAVLALALQGCASLAELQKTPGHALPAAADSPLAALAPPDLAPGAGSAFRPLAFSSFAMDARLTLIRQARRSLDIQYYLIADDLTGRAFLRAVRDAAERGVRVRILVDDLYTAANDHLLQGMAATPNVQIRLFNPFPAGRALNVTRWGLSLLDLARLNHRMHNKLMIADGAFAIVGGRNVADEYFARSASFNFVDMDVLAAGAVIRQLAGLFDTYWNSSQAYAVEDIVRDPADSASLRRDFDRLVDGGDQMRAVNPPRDDMLGNGPLAAELDAGHVALAWGTATAFADRPGKVMATSPDMARSMSVQMNVMDRVMQSRTEAVISSPYFIPGEAGVKAFGDLRRRNVEVSVLTNSLAANDVPLVHAGYARYRVALLRADVALYELSPTQRDQEDRPMLPGVSLGRLHAKTAVIDRRIVYMGSMNLDPRSETGNTELGILVDCPELASHVLRVLEMNKRLGAYRVRLATDGHGLEWTAQDGDRQTVVFHEPEATPLLLLRSMLFGPFVPEQLL